MKACTTCNQCRGPYASATRLTKSGNDMDVTQHHKPSHHKSHIPFESDTFLCNTYYCIELSTILEILLYYSFFPPHHFIYGGVLNINYCCDLFTDYISARAHYSRLCSTIVPSVACQTTEGKYHSTNHFPTY